jgi:hypothetical protein
MHNQDLEARQTTDLRVRTHQHIYQNARDLLQVKILNFCTVRSIDRKNFVWSITTLP